jgi:hypothetical protein
LAAIFQATGNIAAVFLPVATIIMGSNLNGVIPVNWTFVGCKI